MPPYNSAVGPVFVTTRRRCPVAKRWFGGTSAVRACVANADELAAAAKENAEIDARSAMTAAGILAIGLLACMGVAKCLLRARTPCKSRDRPADGELLHLSPSSRDCARYESSAPTTLSPTMRDRGRASRESRHSGQSFV